LGCYFNQLPPLRRKNIQLVEHYLRIVLATLKTIYNDHAVADFIAQLDDAQKRSDSIHLITLMQKITGVEARMFGKDIIGFGEYHYVYASGHEGSAPLLAFSPRKAALSLYIYAGAEQGEQLLEGLGKFKMGKACIYAKKISDLNEEVLLSLMDHTVAYVSQKYQRIH